MWSATIIAGNARVPCRFLMSGTGARLQGSFFNGDKKVSSATTRFENNTIVFGYPEYGSTLELTLAHGSLEGNYFSGARPLRLELTPNDNATLRVELDSYDTYTAVRAKEARARGLPEPTDPSRFTSVRDPGAPFEFSFPDIDGRVVANTDARFRRKVVIVSIGGSWCPNCHDEAPFLMELYRNYREKGLEVVFLAFEEGDQLKGLEQLRAFIQRYDVEFAVLVPGDLRLLHMKVPQAVNLEVLPTTFMIGRDGLVRGVRTGFAGEPTGAFHASLKEEMTTQIEHLLAER